jgi:hypothetical protein
MGCWCHPGGLAAPVAWTGCTKSCSRGCETPIGLTGPVSWLIPPLSARWVQVKTATESRRSQATAHPFRPRCLYSRSLPPADLHRTSALIYCAPAFNAHNSANALQHCIASLNSPKIRPLSKQMCFLRAIALQPLLRDSVRKPGWPEEIDLLSFTHSHVARRPQTVGRNHSIEVGCVIHVFLRRLSTWVVRVNYGIFGL